MGQNRPKTGQNHPSTQNRALQTKVITILYPNRISGTREHSGALGSILGTTLGSPLSPSGSPSNLPAMATCLSSPPPVYHPANNRPRQRWLSSPRSSKPNNPANPKILAQPDTRHTYTQANPGLTAPNTLRSQQIEERIHWDS
jgi:hypothetical protein